MRWGLVALAATAAWLSGCGGAEPQPAAGDASAAEAPRTEPALAALTSAADMAPRPTSPGNDLCLACHANEGVAMKVGEAEQPLAPIPAHAFASSAHSGLACVKCHPGQAAVPHAALAVTREQPLAAVVDAMAVCSECHREAHEGYLDSVHGTVSKLKDKRAPGCADCHSAHSVEPVKEWSSDERAQACARCHEGADATFARASTGHREPSPSWFAPSYFAGRFLVVLMACVLAFGTLHVELDVLRWGWGKVRKHRREEKGS